MSHDQISNDQIDQMSKTDTKLIRMGNQIATFFSSQNDEHAASHVAEHINKFWEPRMRKQLFDIADQSTDGFHELFANALVEINRPES